jgi:hypothetical protein
VTWHHIGGSESVSDSVGRAGTFALVVMTEFGFPTEARFALRALEAFEPTLKRVKAPVILDSTPGKLPGPGEPYRDIARDVIDGRREGGVLHLPWWTFEEYRLDLEPHDLLELATSLTPEELALLKTHRLSMHQLAWRRSELAPRQGETAETARRRFLSSYTESVDDCFVEGGGDQLFESALLESIRVRLLTASIAAPLPGHEVIAAMPAELRAGAVDLVGRPCLQGDVGEGFVRVWSLPHHTSNRRDEYFAGVDCSDGLPGGDWQVLTILDRVGHRACYARVRINKYRFAALVQRIVTWYRAPGVIESQYGELIDRLVAAPVSEDELDRQHGYAAELAILSEPCSLLHLAQTTEPLRRLYMDALFELIADAEWQHDAETLREQRSLERDKKGRIVAMSGEHDDIMLSTSIAAHQRKEAMSRARPRQSRPTRSKWHPRKRRKKYDYLS